MCYLVFCLLLFINCECSPISDQLEIVADKMGNVTILGERSRYFPFIGVIRNTNFGMSHERNQYCVNKYFKPEECSDVHNVFFTKEESEDFRKYFPNLDSSTILVNLTGTKTIYSYPTLGESMKHYCNNDNNFETKCTASKSISVADAVQATSSHEFELGTETRFMIGFYFIGSSELEVKLSGKYKYGFANQISNSRTTTDLHIVETKVPPHSKAVIVITPKLYNAAFEVFFQYKFNGFVVISFKKPCKDHYYSALFLHEFMKRCYPELDDTLTDTYKTSSGVGIDSVSYTV